MPSTRPSMTRSIAVTMTRLTGSRAASKRVSIAPDSARIASISARPSTKPTTTGNNACARSCGSSSSAAAANTMPPVKCWMTLDVFGPGARQAAATAPKQAASNGGNVSSASFAVGVMGPLERLAYRGGLGVVLPGCVVRVVRAGHRPGIDRRLNTLKPLQGQPVRCRPHRQAGAAGPVKAARAPGRDRRAGRRYARCRSTAAPFLPSRRPSRVRPATVAGAWLMPDGLRATSCRRC